MIPPSDAALQLFLITNPFLIVSKSCAIETATPYVAKTVSIYVYKLNFKSNYINQVIN